jgi:hypothetical protein
VDIAVWILLCAMLALSMCFTGSRGAVLASGLGIVLLLAFGRAGTWCAKHARTVLVLLAAAYFALVAGTASYGLAKGTLPHPSLAFRWYYWTAAARAFADAPLAGIGRGNFAAAYMQYKDPRSTEDVRDPHDLWVSLLTELGLLGLLGGLILCGQCVLGGLRGLAPASGQPTTAEALAVRRAVPLVAVLWLVHALFSGTDFRDAGQVWTWAADVAVPWPIAFVVALALLGRVMPGQTIGPHWIAAGLTSALLASLTHSLIDFALLTPGGLAVFVLCAAGAGVGTWEGGNAGTPRGTEPREMLPTAGRVARVLPLLLGAALLVAHGLTVTLPTRNTTYWLARLDRAMRAAAASADWAPVASAARAAVADSRDPSVALAAARASLHISLWPGLDDHHRLEELLAAENYARLAVFRNARDTNTYASQGTIEQHLAEVHERLGEMELAQQSSRAAAESWQCAVDLNPTNPRMRISAGRAWVDLWQRTGDARAAGRARKHLTEALRIDDLRPAQEVVRLRPQERELVAELMRELSPATTMPASAGSDLSLGVLSALPNVNTPAGVSRGRPPGLIASRLARRAY